MNRTPPLLPLFFVCFILQLLIGCTRIPLYGYIEGIVEYDVSYPEFNKEGNIVNAFFPKKAKTYFTRNKTLTEISSAFNLFRIAIVSDAEEKKVRAYLKIMNKRIWTEYDSTQIIKKLSEYPPFIVADKIDNVVGCNQITCSLYKIVFLKPFVPDFDLMASTKIRAGNVFWATPFKDIKGFLLKYQIYYFGLLMSFSCSGISSTSVSNDMFAHDNSYEKVPVDAFEQEIITLLRDFGGINKNADTLATSM